MVPPDSIPNSEVKRNSADGSVGPPHVRVGHRQASHSKKPLNRAVLFFLRFNQRSTSTTHLRGFFI